MEKYDSLLKAALVHLEEVRAAAGQIKERKGSLDSQESRLAVLDSLDDMEEAISELWNTYLRQAVILRKRQREIARRNQQENDDCTSNC